MKRKRRMRMAQRRIRRRIAVRDHFAAMLMSTNQCTQFNTLLFFYSLQTKTSSGNCSLPNTTSAFHFQNLWFDQWIYGGLGDYGEVLHSR